MYPRNLFGARVKIVLKTKVPYSGDGDDGDECEYFIGFLICILT